MALPGSGPLRYLRITAGRRVGELLHTRGLAQAGLYVMAFPKSGGTWVKNMLGDALRAHDAATGRPSGEVVHGHWRYTPSLRPAVYVLRDGRDVVVSLYFHHLREVRKATLRSGHIDAYLRRTLGPNYDLDNVAANLPPIIKSLDTQPFGGILRTFGNRRFLSWPNHVADWSQRPGVLPVRYESLLADAPSELGRIVAWAGLSLRDNQVADIAERWNFRNVTGRLPGEADAQSFVRKGIAGDWRNHFDPEAAAAFDRFAGQTLIDLGYEPDRSWIQQTVRQQPDTPRRSPPPHGAT